MGRVIIINQTVHSEWVKNICWSSEDSSSCLFIFFTCFFLSHGQLESTVVWPWTGHKSITWTRRDKPGDTLQLFDDSADKNFGGIVRRDKGDPWSNHESCLYWRVSWLRFSAGCFRMLGAVVLVKESLSWFGRWVELSWVTCSGSECSFCVTQVNLDVILVCCWGLILGVTNHAE